VVDYGDFLACKGEAGAKEKWKMPRKGKEYVARNGVVRHFRFEA